MRLIDADVLEADIAESEILTESAKFVFINFSDLQPTVQTPQWTSCDDHQPDIDMSYAHSDTYLVTYDGGAMDVAYYTNVNPFWTTKVVSPWWNGVQFAKVIAWMPLPKPYARGEQE